MDLDKIFIKTFLNNFEEEDFTVKLWDGEEVKLGQNSSKFKVTFNEPLKKNELLKERLSHKRQLLFFTELAHKSCDCYNNSV